MKLVMKLILKIFILLRVCPILTKLTPNEEASQERRIDKPIGSIKKLVDCDCYILLFETLASELARLLTFLTSRMAGGRRQLVAGGPRPWQTNGRQLKIEYRIRGEFNEYRS